MFDVFVVLYIAVDMWFGFRYGTFRRIIHLFAFFLGLLLAQAVSVGFAQLLNTQATDHPISYHYLVYMGILFALVIISEILGFAYASALTFLNAMIFDRFFGIAVGLVGALLEMSIVLYIFTSMFTATGPSGTSQLPILRLVNDQIGISLIKPALETVQTVSKVIYAPVIPQNYGQYFGKTYS
jgi:uncharacterized membrane protein required for colicin V production